MSLGSSTLSHGWTVAMVAAYTAAMATYLLRSIATGAAQAATAYATHGTRGAVTVALAQVAAWTLGRSTLGTVATIVALAPLSALFAVGAAIAPCPTDEFEGSTLCVWDASTLGNGEGSDFLRIGNGTVITWDGSTLGIEHA